jgi:hypothetical protein
MRRHGHVARRCFRVRYRAISTLLAGPLPGDLHAWPAAHPATANPTLPSPPPPPKHSFGGVSPEQKAANHLRALFTFVACKVILAQLEGSGRGALGAYNAPAYTLLSEQLQAGGAGAISRDPDAWLEGLLEKDPALGGLKNG